LYAAILFVQNLALSGKAKERAKEAIFRDTFTIHSFLIQISSKDSELNNSGDPLVIVDEASMVDIALMLKHSKCFRQERPISSVSRGYRSIITGGVWSFFSRPGEI
jgi:tRNA(Met) C34 N-acetyltransferase TmcA